MQTAGSNGAPTPEGIVEWLQQEMGYRTPPSPEALRKICRGNMMLVWKFLLDRVKSDQTVEKIRRNIHVHGSPLKSSFTAKREGADDAGKSEAEALKIERTNSGKTTITVRRKGRSRPGTADSAKGREGVDREKEKDKVPDNEESIEKALRERDAAEHEVEKLRLSVQRMAKDLKSRMLDVSKEELERQRLLDDKANVR